MTDATMNESGISPERASRLRTFGIRDRRFKNLSRVAALLILAIFIGIMISLGVGSFSAFKTFGYNFFTTDAWNPVTGKFGAVAAIYGTLLTAALAMLMAVPVGIGIAVFLTEICPRAFRRPIGIAIELLAGIPSIIYGIWGLFVFAPFFQTTVQPWIIDAFANVPVLQDLFAGPPYGIGVFTASLILSIMILPFISAVTRDVFDTVPHPLKEAGYAIGCTTAEVIWNVVLPFARTGVVGGTMLALGRALGETMAVTFVIGNAHHLKWSLFAPGTTISAAIANEFTEADTPIYLASLIAIGLILFFITFVVLAVAQFMLYRLELRAGKNT